MRDAADARLSRVFAIAVVLVACGDDDAPRTTPDASVGPDLGTTEDAAIAPPMVAEAALPMLEACPTGWERHEAAARSVAVCLPWTADEPPSCGTFEARFPGDPACARVGEACPADDWSDALPADATILFVRANALSGRRGTRESPMRLSDAIARAGEGTIIALAKGTYGEVVPVAAGVTLWGACVAETHLTLGAPDGMYPVVLMQGDGGVVRNVHVTGAAPGIAVIDDVEAHVEDVVIEAATQGGMLVVDGAHLTGRNVVVRETGATARGDGVGILVRASRVELERVVLGRNRDYGLQVFGVGADVTITDIAVSSTMRRDDGSNGFGVSVFDRARVRLERALVEDSGTTAVHVDRCLDVDDGPCLTAEPGARIELVDAVVRGSQRTGDGPTGYGFQVRDGAVDGMRVLVDDNRSTGLVVGAGGSVRLEDAVVQATRAQADSGNLGRGINAQQGATVELVRVLFATSREAALVANEAPTLVTMTDVTVSETLGRDCDGAHGRAFQIQDGAELVGERVSIESASEYGILTFASPVTLTDLEIAMTGPGGCRPDDTCSAPSDPSTIEPACRDLGGIGLGAFEAGSITVTGFALVGNALSGAFLTTGGTLDLHRGLVRGHPVGIAVSSEGFDTERLRDDVVYLENDDDIAARELTVPDRIDTL